MTERGRSRRVDFGHSFWSPFSSFNPAQARTAFAGHDFADLHHADRLRAQDWRRTTALCLCKGLGHPGTGRTAPDGQQPLVAGL